MSTPFLNPSLKTVFAAVQSTNTNNVCNILGKMTAKQNVVASISIQSFNRAKTFYLITKFLLSVVNTKTKNIATLIQKSGDSKNKSRLASP